MEIIRDILLVRWTRREIGLFTIPSLHRIIITSRARTALSLDIHLELLYISSGTSSVSRKDGIQPIPDMELTPASKLCQNSIRIHASQTRLINVADRLTPTERHTPPKIFMEQINHLLHPSLSIILNFLISNPSTNLHRTNMNSQQDPK